MANFSFFRKRSAQGSYLQTSRGSRTNCCSPNCFVYSRIRTRNRIACFPMLEVSFLYFMESPPCYKLDVIGPTVRLLQKRAASLSAGERSRHPSSPNALKILSLIENILISQQTNSPLHASICISKGVLGICAKTSEKTSNPSDSAQTCCRLPCVSSPKRCGVTRPPRIVGASTILSFILPIRKPARMCAAAESSPSPVPPSSNSTANVG